MEFQTISGKPHYVFDNYDEFRTYCVRSGINPIPKIKKWRDGLEGDWVWSDDNRILQILKRKDYKESEGRTYVRTVVGTFNTRQGVFMDSDFSQHPNRYLFSKKIKNHFDARTRDKKITGNEKLWVSEIVLLGCDPVETYKRIFGTGCDTLASSNVSMLLRQERIIKYMDKLVLDTAKTLGLDHEWVLSRYKNMAEESKSENVALSAIDRIAEVLGTLGDKQKDVKQIGVFKGFGSDSLRAIEGHASGRLQEAEIVE